MANRNKLPDQDMQYIDKLMASCNIEGKPETRNRLMNIAISMAKDKMIKARRIADMSNKSIISAEHVKLAETEDIQMKNKFPIAKSNLKRLNDQMNTLTLVNPILEPTLTTADLFHMLYPPKPSVELIITPSSVSENPPKRHQPMFKFRPIKTSSFSDFPNISTSSLLINGTVPLEWLTGDFFSNKLLPIVEAVAAPILSPSISSDIWPRSEPSVEPIPTPSASSDILPLFEPSVEAIVEAAEELIPPPPAFSDVLSPSVEPISTPSASSDILLLAKPSVEPTMNRTENTLKRHNATPEDPNIKTRRYSNMSNPGVQMKVSLPLSKLSQLFRSYSIPSKLPPIIETVEEPISTSVEPIPTSVEPISTPSASSNILSPSKSSVEPITTPSASSDILPLANPSVDSIVETVEELIPPPSAFSDILSLSKPNVEPIPNPSVSSNILPVSEPSVEPILTPLERYYQQGAIPKNWSKMGGNPSVELIPKIRTTVSLNELTENPPKRHHTMPKVPLIKASRFSTVEPVNNQMNTKSFSNPCVEPISTSGSFGYQVSKNLTGN